ncbi:MAG: hypothetical protein K2X54_19165 [Methylobacterium organophilum]|nr:hypothetical protein [Methylobacterium organophilum]
MVTIDKAALQAEVARLEARLIDLAQEVDEDLALLREARCERAAIVDGEMAGDPGIAWTNEERAQAAYDASVERYQAAYWEHWQATDELRD